jgi:glycosyltransferase involved in cell wall biosynthesis
MREKLIVMLGIHPDSKEKGGISTVVDIYRSAGLFERWPIRYVGTMASGSQVGKLRIAMVALLSFVRLLVGGRVALVHAHTASRASFWRKSMFMLLARAARKPVVLHLHGAEFERFYRDECGPLRRAFIRNVLNGAERVVVLSSQWQRAIERIAPRAHVCTIVNPIDLPARARTAAERAANVVLFLGRFGPRKGIYDLLQAIEIVKQRVPDVKLRCGGDGDVEGVRARVSARGLESNVEVLGWVAGQAKEKELERAAVYVLPSYAEGLPMGVLEAMAAGTPVVTTNVGGIPEAVDDGVNGYVIQPGDIAALADRIVRLLDDAALRDRFGAAARQKVEAVFCTERVIGQIEALYAELGAQPRRTANTAAHVGAGDAGRAPSSA